MERNKIKLDKLKCPYKIIRWQELLKNEKFEEQKKYVEFLLETKEYFKQAFERSINTFIKRLQARKTDLNVKTAQELTASYIKEELSVSILPEFQTFDYLAYPNSLNPALYNIFQQIRSNLSNPAILQPLTIKFSSYSFFNSSSSNNNCNNNCDPKNNDVQDIKKDLIINMICGQIQLALLQFSPHEREEVLVKLKTAINHSFEKNTTVAHFQPQT